MESLCSFEPVWSREEAIATPRGTLKDLHRRVFQFLMKDENQLRTSEVPTIEEVVRIALRAIEGILCEEVEDENIIVKRLRQAGAHRDDKISPVKDSIRQWYRSAVPAVTRDPSSGMAPDGHQDANNPGAATDVWDRDQAAEQFFYGNMGLMGMLMNSDAWIAPSEPRLFKASLCANAITSLLYAAYMIIASSRELRPSAVEIPEAQTLDSFRLFIQSAWLLARQGHIQPPGADHSTTSTEVKISSDGKRLLTKIGRTEWSEAPLWHPVRKVPGSPWNKFIKNTGQKMFPTRTDIAKATKFQVPSSALTLIEPWEQYYSDIRSRIDETGRLRNTCTPTQARRQFSNLSEQSGSPYKNRSLTEMDALRADDINQVYAYHLPMVKKAIADARGNLTLPFLTTAGRALRFEEDPQELEAEFFVMTFDS